MGNETFYGDGLTSKTSPVFLQNNDACPEIREISHDHKEYIRENREINAFAKETYHRLMEAVK